MKRFNYKVIEKDSGKVVRGSIQAESEHAAGKLLLQQGYIPQSVKEISNEGWLAKIFGKVKTKDRIVFTRQFATLIGAGLPLSNSLKTLIEQTESKTMKAVIEDIQANIEAGKSLSEALKAHPDVFNDVYLALVAAGEASGTLDVALERLATQDEKDNKMMSDIKGAMVYPAILFVVILAVLVFMMVAVVPEVDNLYKSMDEELPELTQVLVNLTNSMMTYWWILVLVIGAIVGLLVRFKKTPTGKKVFAAMKLNVPLFGKLFQKLYMTRFGRTMEMLLGTGVAMLDAMQISADATANEVTTEIIKKASEKVKSGKALSESLRGKKYILPLIPQMASIGEESGKIDEMMGRAARVYEGELDESIKNISTMIEPFLMLVMAGLIAVVLMGALMPIYSLVSTMG